MTSTAFVFRLAWREARAARRRLVLLTASVMAGVGALVAVNSFTENLKVSVAEQAQALLLEHGGLQRQRGQGPARPLASPGAHR